MIEGVQQEVEVEAPCFGGGRVVFKFCLVG